MLLQEKYMASYSYNEGFSLLFKFCAAAGVSPLALSMACIQAGLNYDQKLYKNFNFRNMNEQQFKKPALVIFGVGSLSFTSSLTLALTLPVATTALVTGTIISAYLYSSKRDLFNDCVKSMSEFNQKLEANLFMRYFAR